MGHLLQFSQDLKVHYDHVKLSHLLFLMHHDVRFETGDTGELFLTHGAGGLGCAVSRLVQHEVKLHVVRLGALITAVRLQPTDSHEE